MKHLTSYLRDRIETNKIIIAQISSDIEVCRKEFDFETMDSLLDERIEYQLDSSRHQTILDQINLDLFKVKE